MADSVILDSWSSGSSKTISSGTSRCLFVAIGKRDDGGTVPAFGTIKWGGRTLTQLYTQSHDGGSVDMGLWVGYLPESEIAQGSGTSITETGGASAIDVIHSASYKDVKQSDPNGGSCNDYDTTSDATITCPSSISITAEEAAFVVAHAKNSMSTSGVTTGFTEAQDENIALQNMTEQTRAAGSSATPTPTNTFTAGSNVKMLFAMAVANATVVTSSGALASGASAMSGIENEFSSGALASGASAVSGSGEREVVSSGSLASAAASVSGMKGINSSGAMASEPARAKGYGGGHWWTIEGEVEGTWVERLEQLGE